MIATIDSMSFLEWIAWLGVDIPILGIAIACDFDEKFKHKLIHDTRIVGWFLVGIPQKPIGWTLGLGARILAPCSSADKFEQQKGIAWYHHRRTHRPNHLNSFWSGKEQA